MKTGTRFICFTIFVASLVAAAPLAFGQEAPGTVGRPIPFVSSTFATGTTPRCVVAADFNNDGLLDLATAGATTISVLLGNRGGTFEPHIDSIEGSSPTTMAAGDFNRDGKLDLAVADFTPGTITIMEGNGDGTFQKKSAINVGPQRICRRRGGG